MKNKLLFSIMFLVMSIAQSLAQTIDVKGTVVSKSDGEPLIGANVHIEGTSIGTITDFDGNFTLQNVEKKAKLKFSYVGFTTQVLDAESQMNVTLSEDNELQEIVVTGYQVQRKADLTGAVSVVSMTDLQKQNENNPMKALQGRVPGMNVEANGNPSGAATIRIRGNGTLNDNDPLYIIDGVPTKSGMHELNGNDIEPIQVLKDAASASIYGSRAANGVIIITTKKGKNGKVKVDFDASVAAQLYAHKLEVLNTKEYGTALWQAFVNDGKNPNTNGLGYNYDWGYNANGNPVLNGMTLNKYLDESHITPAADTDWFGETTRTGVAQQYNISLSAGSEKSSQFFSLGYYKNDGIIKQTDFERFSARMNTEFKLVNDVVTVGEHFTLNRTSEVCDPGNLQLCLQYPSIIPVYDETGAYAGPHGGYTSYENPVARLDRNSDNRYKYWRTFGDVYLNVNPLKNLNIKTTFGIDYAQKEQRLFTFPRTEGTAANKTNSSEAKQEHWTKWMWNLVGTYNLEKNKHRADFLGGIELNREDSEMFSAVGNDYAIFDTNYMWPEIGTGVPKVYSGADGYTLVSFFGKANYTYNDRYMASFTLRHDGSSRFGKNNKYGTFPSFSAGWRISEEKFLKDKASWLDNLKLRASWGQTGNQQIPTTARYSLYKSTYGTITDAGSSYDTAYDIAGNNQGTLSSGFKRIQVGNEDLKWETTTQTNIGLDFTLFGNAIYGSFEWYHKNTKDILVNMPSIAVGGEGANQFINAGEVQNRGIEFNMGWRGETKSGLSWDITGNLSTNRNEIKKLPATLISRGTFGGNAENSIIGHAMGSQVGYVFDGIFQNQQEVDNHAKQEQAAPGRMRIKDINGDGVINDKDQTWIYDPTPDFCYGINVYLQYKNFDFTMFWQGVQGVDVITRDLKRETDLWAGVNVANLNKGTRLLGAWTPENTGSLIPALTSTPIGLEQAMSSYYVENGSYLKLRTVQFGYNLPKDITKKLYMERMRVYLSAQNLLTIKSKNFTGVDPENAGYAYPIPVSITFGLNVTF
ncbi:MAG: TonB-dependent receptor [Bacteroidales bacterium]|nr:TonB-dependent receptor [Candidatus Minthousia equi]